ncbi:CocE/NonD family hydrolase C-terminal non-catalytic domain-containing protein, partial [Amycolatopsis keratiniphila]
YTMTFRLASTDHVVPQGHQLALIIGGTDGSFISGPAQYPKITVDLGKTSLALPVAGSGPSAVPAALPAAPAQIAPATVSGLERG